MTASCVGRSFSFARVSAPLILCMILLAISTRPAEPFAHQRQSNMGTNNRWGGNSKRLSWAPQRQKTVIGLSNVESDHSDQGGGDDTQYNNDEKPMDKRPHEQRTAGPRKARRLNHPFQHLYRHDEPAHYPNYENSTKLEGMSSREYLVQYGGYSHAHVDEMNRTFPPLLDLDVIRHLRPKLRFLKHSLGGGVSGNPTLEGEKRDNDEIKSRLETVDATPPAPSKLLSDLGRCVPPQYFGARLEKTVAPRHAFMMHMKLPHGPILLQDDGKLCREFLVSSRRTKQFCALCNTWRRKFGVYDPEGKSLDSDGAFLSHVTPRQVEAFDTIFQRGLMASARNDIDDSFSQYANVTSGQMVNLLVRHGANPLEEDVRGVSLLHWAAGAGNIDGLKELIDTLPGGIAEALHLKAGRDAATPLHWAAAGAKPKEFGCGGHIDVCRFLLGNCQGDEKDLVNSLTKDGNSVLMWAAWSGTLDVVKFLIRHRADAFVENRNGCTVTHWAASGGDLEVCKYLFSTVGVDFITPNYAGNTPLSHAVAYGRVDVVRWLKEDVYTKGDDVKAAELAWDFVGWTDGDVQRKKVFDLFQDWDGTSIDDEVSAGEDQGDEYSY